MRIKTSIKKVCSFIFLTLVIAGLSSCKKGNNASTSVQIVNASPDAGTVDLYISGNLKNTTPISYGNTSGYLSAIAGNQTAEIKTSSNATTVVTTPVNLTADEHYSIFLTGRSATGSLGSIVVKDDLAAPSSGKAKVRFINTVTASPDVNFNLAGTTAALFTGVAYKTATDFKEVTPGTYTLTAVSSSVTAVTAASANQTIVAGKIYTVYFKGQLGTTTGATKLDLGVITNN